MNDNPHDTFFRESFGRKEIPRDFIRNYAPPEIVAQIDLDTLEPVDGTFVDDDLQTSQSDMLFRVASQKGDLLLYFLFEHKSYSDYATPLQLLRYMVRIWEKEPKPTTKRKLPPILPFVIYHGESRWLVKTQFSESVESADGMSNFTPSFEYAIADLSPLADVEIRGTILLQLFLGILNAAFDRNAAERLPKLFDLYVELHRQQTAMDYIKVVLNYLAVGARYLERDELIQIYTQHSADKGESIMSIAQEWFDEGKEIGIEQGAIQARVDSTLRLLEWRFGKLPESVSERIQQINQINKLDSLFEAAFQSSSLEIFMTKL